MSRSQASRLFLFNLFVYFLFVLEATDRIQTFVQLPPNISKLRKYQFIDLYEDDFFLPSAYWLIGSIHTIV